MGPHVWANEGVAHRFCCCVMCCDRCISVLLPEDARRSRGSDDRGGEATGSWCNDALRDPGNDQIPEVPELRPHDLPGYFRVHPMDCNWEPQLVCKTLWVRAVDAVLAGAPWNSWRCRRLPRRTGVRSPD